VQFIQYMLYCQDSVIRVRYLIDNMFGWMKSFIKNYLIFIFPAPDDCIFAFGALKQVFHFERIICALIILPVETDIAIIVIYCKNIRAEMPVRRRISDDHHIEYAPVSIKPYDFLADRCGIPAPPETED